MIWDNDFAVSVIPLLLEGLWVTVKITLLGTLLAAALGLFFAVLRRLAIPVLSPVVSFFVVFVRGTRCWSRPIVHFLSCRRTASASTPSPPASW